MADWLIAKYYKLVLGASLSVDQGDLTFVVEAGAKTACIKALCMR